MCCRPPFSDNADVAIDSTTESPAIVTMETALVNMGSIISTLRTDQALAAFPESESARARSQLNSTVAFQEVRRLTLLHAICVLKPKFYMAPVGPVKRLLLDPPLTVRILSYR